MPLIKPEIQKALRAAGFASKSPDLSDSSDDKSSFQLQLEKAGLGLEDTLEQLSNISRSSVSEHLKLRSIETVLKLHQVLKEQPSQIPQVTIVINDSSGRDSAINNTNPIFLPRELLTTLESKTPQYLENQGGDEDAFSESESEDFEERPN